MSEPTANPSQPEALPPYRLLQKGETANIAASDLDSLVTHHPGANRNAVFRDGVPIGVENADRRSYGMVGAELQELETRRTDGGARSALGADQVLVIKDFMLEDSRIASGGAGVRDVDVPSPVAGYVGRRVDDQGLVEIYDRQGGEVIARMRHLSGIEVNVGDTVAYGQALGTQDRIGLPATAGKHVHLEVDTRYYQQLENYMEDLSNGRLAIDPARRGAGIEARPVVDDGVIRVGESDPRVADVQRVLHEQGYRDRDGQAIAQDGVYRLSMQPALIQFQERNGIPVTGDIDARTLELAPPQRAREIDRMDYMENGRIPAQMRGADAGPRGVDHPDHPGHRMYANVESRVHRHDAEIGRTPDEASSRLAAGIVVGAMDRDLRDVGFLGFTPDGTKAFMTDTTDPSAPWARTAVVDVAAAVAKPFSESSERIAQQAMAQEQALNLQNTQQIAQQVDGPGQGGPVHTRVL